jgi:hypothetical protein
MFQDDFPQQGTGFWIQVYHALVMLPDFGGLGWEHPFAWSGQKQK